MCTKEKRAYMTVEASIIMPMIVIVLVFILYIGFYLYDVCVAGQFAYIAALRTSQQKELTMEELEAYGKKQLEELVTDRLVVTDTRQEKIKVTVRKIEVEISTMIQMPFSNFISEKMGLWKIRGNGEVVRTDPVKYIRSVRGKNDS